MALETVAPVVARSAPHLLLQEFPAEFCQLVADMCMDRGLEASARLQLVDLMPFDDVLAAMSAISEPLRKRTGFCEVMRCLYVDAVPQVPMALSQRRVDCLGGSVYPAPEAKAQHLLVLSKRVQYILFRGPDFHAGVESPVYGGVGAWRRWVSIARCSLVCLCV